MESRIDHKKAAARSSRFLLFRRDDDERDQVDQNARHAARDEGDQHGETEPERTDAEEFAKSATYTSDDAVLL